MSKTVNNDQILREAMHLQAIEDNPLDADQVAMFEMFERKGWSNEKRLAYIHERVPAASMVPTAEWGTLNIVTQGKEMRKQAVARFRNKRSGWPKAEMSVDDIMAASKEARLEIRVSQDQLKALKEAAQKQGIPHARLVRQFIEQGMLNLGP